MNARVRGGVGFSYDFVKASVDRLLAGFGVTEVTWRDACAAVPGFAASESPAYVARGVAALAADPERARFAGRVLTARQLSDAYGGCRRGSSSATGDPGRALERRLGGFEASPGAGW